MSMLVVEQKKGEHFIKRGERLKDINIVLDGTVSLKTRNDEFILESGSVIGLMECSTGKYACDYVAREKSLIVSYAFQNIDDFKNIFDEQPQYVYAFLHAVLVQSQMLFDRYNLLQKNARELYLFMMKQYREYQLMCKKLEIEPILFERANDIKPVAIERPIRQWEVEYIDALSKQSSQLMKQFYMTNSQLCVGEIIRTSQLMNIAIDDMEQLIDYIEINGSIIFDKDKNDIINLWFELAKQMTCMGIELETVNKKMREMQGFFVDKKLFEADTVFARFQEYWQFDFEKYAKENEAKKAKKAEADEPDETDYFEYIINYAGYEEDRKVEIRELMAEFRKIAGSESKDREILDVRNRANEMFFDTYTRVFFRTLENEGEPSAIMQLFLKFGFMDPQLLEEEQISKLFALNQTLEEKKKENVYSFYDWLKMIQSGERETSKNEFDLDYFASLRELRKANKITADEEKRLQHDKERKLRFELENMFRSGSKGTYGRGGIYSPILSKYSIPVPLEGMLVAPDKLVAAIDKIRAIDFGCFYREVLFYDPAHDTGRMMIQKEVLPDVILMPNVGQRAMMWQESENHSRESAARFLFPILSVSDIDACMIDVVGKYRWEICRKLQGMRWNDVTEPSLTSEYYDFLEFYKKNRNLSASAKEKLKSALTRAKGSYREVFVADYINWIKYESAGNFRLNKVARDILSKYCPFPQDIRFKLMENPMFKGIFSKYENLMIQQQTKVRNNLTHYKHSGGEITEELMDTLHFYGK